MIEENQLLATINPFVYPTYMFTIKDMGNESNHILETLHVCVKF